MAITQHPITPQAPANRGVVLRRDRGDNPGGGVAAGIANYLAIDVIFVRAIFILLSLAFGIGYIMYIALYFMTSREEDGDIVRFPAGSSQVRKARLIAGLIVMTLGAVVAALTLLPSVNWYYILAGVIIGAGALIVICGSLWKSH